MAQQLGSKQQVEHRAAARGVAVWSVAAALAGAVACATGVDVSDTELEEICATPGVVCGDAPAPSAGSGGTGPVGSSGASGSNPVGTSGSGGVFTATGGSTSGASGTTGTGTGGSAGASSPTLQPLARGTCMAEDDVVIVYTDRGMGTTNQATMVLHVQNDGPSFDLTDLTIRYWFTDDGLSDFTADIDYASQGGGMNTTSAVTRTFGEELGSNYVSIGFSSAGTVGPEGVDTIQMRLHANNYQTLELTNDFSYQGGASATPNRNITPYVNGVQVGGCVPIPP